jgi:hypothetical protein
MSDETFEKPPRKEPVLQPMRVVQVPDVPVTSVSTSPVPNKEAVPTDDKGNKLVMGKKEYEKIKKAKAVPYHKPITPTASIVEANAKIIEDLDRNAKLGRNSAEQAPEYDYDWLKKVGGKHAVIAWLQTPISVSGFISSESTFSPQKIRGLTMSWQNNESEYGQGLLYKIENTNGNMVHFIPSSNVKDVGF